MVKIHVTPLQLEHLTAAHGRLDSKAKDSPHTTGLMQARLDEWFLNFSIAGQNGLMDHGFFLRTKPFRGAAGTQQGCQLGIKFECDLWLSTPGSKRDSLSIL